ncbi:MAG: fibronectin type III domain-containing protein, partial [Gammaproteobacteria bacterium]|nr:fibronectin type III domain-containing protein [Gammaproteobacteria bacterium]
YSGSTAITESPSGAYSNNINNATLTYNSSVDLSASTNVVVQYYAKWDIERNFDYVQIQGSTNGSTWTTLCGKYTKPGSDYLTNRYSSSNSTNTSTGKSVSDQNNQPSGDLIYDADTMDKWVMEEIYIDVENNSALLGASNVQFRFLFDSDNTNRADGYPTTFDGFVFDDFKIIDIQIPCETTVPTNLSSASISASEATISWDNIPSATYDLRYKAVASSTWIDVLDLSATSTILTGLTASTNYEVQVRSKCDTATSAYTSSITFSTTAVNYCASNGGDATTYFYTNNVSFGTINNNSTSNAAGYEDFTAISTSLEQNTTHTISVSKYYIGTQYPLATSVWIDFNKDGDFGDAGEQVLTNGASTASPITANITIPNDALVGTTRMRVTNKYYSTAGSTATDPCESFGYGEVEDYTINITSPPTAVCQDITVQLDATGSVTITPDQIDNGSTDDGALAYSLDVDTFNCTHVGTPQTVTLTVTDIDSQTDSCTATVTVEDNPIPVVETLPDLTAECSISVTDVPEATDCDSTITGLTGDPLSYSDQGTFTIEWTYIGSTGITVQNQTVIIDDVTPPVTPTIADATGDCSVTPDTPTTTDTCEGTISGTTTTTFPITTVGTTVVTWTFDDGNGNSTTADQNVIVSATDNSPPESPTLADVTVGECSGTPPTPTTTDSCDGTIVGTTTTVFPITTQGTTIVTWTFTDSSSNSTTANQNVIVDDTTDPTPDVATLADVTAECSVTALTAPTATDNCSGTVTASHNATLPISTQGTTTVTWTYDDGNGNTSAQTQDVVIDDVTAPVADLATLADVTAECSVTALTAPTATDAC